MKEQSTLQQQTLHRTIHFFAAEFTQGQRRFVRRTLNV